MMSTPEALFAPSSPTYSSGEESQTQLAREELLRELLFQQMTQAQPEETRGQKRKAETMEPVPREVKRLRGEEPLESRLKEAMNRLLEKSLVLAVTERVAAEKEARINQLMAENLLQELRIEMLEGTLPNIFQS